VPLQQTQEAAEAEVPRQRAQEAAEVAVLLQQTQEAAEAEVPHRQVQEEAEVVRSRCQLFLEGVEGTRSTARQQRARNRFLNSSLAQ
jgi:hypothetical protein